MNKNIVLLIFGFFFIGVASYLTYPHFKRKLPCQFKNKFILFDFDGTLIDSRKELIKAFNQTLKEYGYQAEVTYQDIRKTSLSDLLKERNISFWRIPFLQKRALQIMSEHLDEINPFPGTREFLLNLKAQGFNLGILTSNAKKNVEYILHKHNLEIFDVIYSEASIFGKAKVFNSFLNEYHLDPLQVIYVGDETRDVQAAHAVNVPIVAVSWGNNDEIVLAQRKPEVLINTQIELIPAIEKLINNSKAKNVLQ